MGRSLIAVVISLCIAVSIVAAEFDVAGYDFEVVSSAGDFSVADKPSPKNRVLMVTEEWCPPCQTFKAIEVPRLKDAKWTFGDKTCHVEYVSYEEGSKYGVREIPAFILLSDEKPVSTVLGYMTAKQFTDWYYVAVKPKSVVAPVGSDVAVRGSFKFLFWEFSS